MIYEFSLRATGLGAGLLLVLSHGFALFRPGLAIPWARAFPRSRGTATVLLAVSAVWSFFLVRSIDLGEFSPLRTIMLVAICAGAVLSWIYVPEFLAVRSLGMLQLLLAEPLLESAQLRGEPSRLLLVALSYVWVVAGLFYVGMPYLLRDWIAWATSPPGRFRLLAAAGLGYGIALVVCALAFW